MVVTQGNYPSVPVVPEIASHVVSRELAGIGKHPSDLTGISYWSRPAPYCGPA